MLSKSRSLFSSDKVSSALVHIGDCRWLPLADITVKGLGCDCGGKVILDVEAVLPRGVIDRRVLTADVDAGVGLITRVRWCFGQVARPTSFQRSRTGGVLLIPVSGRVVGAVCDGEEQNEEKVSGTPRSVL